MLLLSTYMHSSKTIIQDKATLLRYFGIPKLLQDDQRTGSPSRVIILQRINYIYINLAYISTFSNSVQPMT